MRTSLSTALLITLFLVAASAAPSSLRGRSFKVERVRQSNYVRNGQSALRKAYLKYGLAVPESLSVKTATLNTSNESRSTGDVSTAPEQGDTEFLSPVLIGGQTLMLDFDTGSSDLWVFNTHMSTSELSGHNVYDPSKSTTFKTMEGSTFKISYGDSSKAEGIVGTDTVNIGGAVVLSQPIELATAVSSEFIEDTQSDGLVGLAFSTLNTIKPLPQKTFFDNAQQSLAQPLFTVNLKHATAGAYEFGIIDGSQFKGSLTFTPVDTSHGYWQFASNGFAVGNGSTQSNSQASPIIADTGTSLLVLDDDVVEAYYSHVPNAITSDSAGGIVFPCDTVLPDFHFALGDKYMATIPGDLLNFSPVPASELKRSVRGRDSDSTALCLGGLQSNKGGPLQIYGDVMFKSQFVVFDAGNTQIGFAPHA